MAPALTLFSFLRSVAWNGGGFKNWFSAYDGCTGHVGWKGWGILVPDNGFGDDPIIESSILRPPLKGVVHRPRLYARLDGGAARKLTVISAPAGYGKTTLVSAWLAQRLPDCCWVSLGPLDGSARRMTTYLEAALDRLEHRERSQESNRWVALLNSLAERQRDTVVVLDDYQLAASAEVNDLVMRLLESLPPRVHAVIITRTDPALHLSKLRGQGELVEIRESDLAFTLEECNAFLTAVSGTSLGNREKESLWHTTEGWIAGLQILASSLKDRADSPPFAGEPSGGRRHLRDYIVEEVLDSLDSTTLEFLERCSILERLSAGLCDAVTGRTDSREMLAEIDRRNLFISPLDEDCRWYRLHHFFAEVLLARFKNDHAEDLPAFHRKASDWFDNHQQPMEAIDHMVGSGDAGAAAQLIDRHANWLMKQGEVMAAKPWVDSLPPEVCANYPALVVLRAWAWLVDGRPLEEIQRQLNAIGDIEAHKVLVMSLRAYLLGLQGDPEQALALSEQALKMTGEQDLFVRGHARFRVAVARLASGYVSEAIALLETAADESVQAGNLPVAVAALDHKAWAMVERGELESGEEAFRRALDLATRRDGSRPGYAAWALIGLGETGRLRGDIDGALALFREGMETAANWLYLDNFYISLGYVHALLAQGRETEALEALESADQFARRAAVPFYFTRLVEAHRSLVMLRRGRLKDARAHLTEPSPSRPGEYESQTEGLVADLEILARARLALMEGDARHCIDLALPLAHRARDQERRLHALHADLLLVQAYWQADEIDEAVSVLERGLSFAAGPGIVQPFVDEGPALARILSRARSLGLNLPFIGKLLAAFPVEQPSTAAAKTQHRTVEPLGAREVTVLTLLSQGLSNKEVAAEIHLSVRTVRWYASTIYAKLGVSSRTQAIAKARQLEILP